MVKRIFLRKRTADRNFDESSASLPSYPASMSPTTSIDEASESSPVIHTAQSSSTSTIPPFVIKATAIASLGGILFGYDMGVVSGALPQLQAAFGLSDRQQEVVVGILYLGGGVGAAVGGTICDSLGRWTSIIITDILFLLGAIVLVWAPTLNSLLVGRVIVGFAISVSGIADVAYLHELAPVAWRGAIVSVNEACISLGFLFAYIAGYALSEIDPTNGWRSMFGLSGALALLQLVGMWTMPESPVWLQEKGYSEQAEQALRVIYGDEPIPVIHNEHTHDAEGRRPSSEPLVADGDGIPSYESLEPKDDASFTTLRSRSWTDIPSLRLKLHSAFHIVYRYRKQVYITLFLSIAQQLSGQTVVLNYAPLIFSKFQNDSDLGSTLYIGMVKFVVTVLVIWKIEKLGRRFLLLSGMSVIVVGLLLITLAASTGIDVDDNGAPVANGRGMVWALPGVLCVVMGYSASFGPLTWLLTSELFPTDIRGRALGTSTIVTYLCASMVTSTFISSQAIVGPGGVFALYALVTTLGIVFAHLAIPDTGGKNVDETEETLMRMWWWRGGVREFVDSSEDRPVLEAELT